MKITIDTVNRSVGIENNGIKLSLIIDQLKKLLGEEWGSYTLNQCVPNTYYNPYPYTLTPYTSTEPFTITNS